MGIPDFARRALGVGGAVALLSGCGGSQSPVGASGAIPKSNKIPSAYEKRTSVNPSVKSCPTATCIYVANGPSGSLSGSITVYPANATGNVKPYRTITGKQTGLTFPSGLAVDSRGEIYVSILPPVQPSSLFIFAATANGDTTPLRTIAGPTTRLERSTGIALDTDANVYAMNSRDTHNCTTVGCVSKGYVTVYAAGSDGNVAPIRFIRGRKTRMLGRSYRHIAVDSEDNVYVANRQGCYVGCRGENAILVYAPGVRRDSSPTWAISGSRTGLNNPASLAVDDAGNVYVINPAIDSHPDSVSVYAAGEHGNTPPIQTISGSNTGLEGPISVAVDAERNIYVSNYLNNSITVYAGGATGNVAPMRTIKGRKTGLTPYAVTLH